MIRWRGPPDPIKAQVVKKINSFSNIFHSRQITPITIRNSEPLWVWTLNFELWRTLQWRPLRNWQSTSGSASTTFAATTKWWPPLESTPKLLSSPPPLQSAKGLSCSLSKFLFPWKTKTHHCFHFKYKTHFSFFICLCNNSSIKPKTHHCFHLVYKTHFSFLFVVVTIHPKKPKPIIVFT